MAKMELMTDELKKNLKSFIELDEIDSEDLTVSIVFFDPFTSWTWYVFGGVIEQNGDVEFYGFVTSPLVPKGEFGYFLLSDLQSLERNILGEVFGIERDINFVETKACKLLPKYLDSNNR
ncbi:DUF2958 domain-containing protein [Desulfuromonas thiophila]|uniref:DUF2958 domain-containing protein n=1 Tax=Desulfuromonas thiophila TaxID=57664 RepID=UPI0024A8520F|nr:hypothetical protein [Desulfuromonas thiophila]